MLNNGGSPLSDFAMTLPTTMQQIFLRETSSGDGGDDWEERQASLVSI